MRTTTDVNFIEVRRLVQMWGGSSRKCPLCRFNLYLCIPALHILLSLLLFTYFIFLAVLSVLLLHNMYFALLLFNCFSLQFLE